jgi:BON domain
VSFRTRSMLAAVVGLWMAHPLPAQEPSTINPPRAAAVSNQQVADSIAAQLRQSGELHAYQISVAFANGVAELSGSVADQGQREAALRLAGSVPGVGRVIDRLAPTDGSGIQLVQDQKQDQKPPASEEGPPPRRTPAINTQGPPGMPAVPGVPGVPAIPGVGTEPVPLNGGAAPSPYDLNPPYVPPYAWPTYAPYNNYSRVAYPTAYPYNAWPFIGPLYPFPKVPLGWRAVKLEWEDGHWWYKKYATKHDWWRVKYW